MGTATIIVCTEIESSTWRWIEGAFNDDNFRFEFARCVPKGTIESSQYFNLARLRGSFKAVQRAHLAKAQALVTHGPTLAAWCSLFAKLFGLKIPILAHSFNFTALPSRLKQFVFSVAFSGVDRFVVYSTIERDLYAKAFGLPADRFDVVLWGVRPPQVETPDVALVQGDYVCALGGNARDYPSLIAAARRLPEIRFVLVVWPENLHGLDLPPNVEVHSDIAYGKAMNILLHSRFMILPLAGSEVPCGHVTLVAAMHLGKAFVITNSAGVQDYVRDGDNAVTAPAGSVGDLVNVTRHLWDSPALCAALGQRGKDFATRECTEERIVEHFRGWLQFRGVGAASTLENKYREHHATMKLPFRSSK